LIYIADVKKILIILRGIEISHIILALGIFTISLIFLTARWKLLTSTYGIKVEYSRLFIFYFIGLFFNNFLPTSIGGDLSRAYYLSRYCTDKAGSIGTVLLERVLGLFATLSLASISLIWVLGYFRSLKILYYTIFLGFMIVIFFALVMSRRLYRRLNGIISLITFYDIGDKLLKVFDTLHFFRYRKKILLGGYIFSLLSQISHIFMNFVLAKSLSLDVSLGYFFLLVPIIFIFSLLPSINGVGVRDAGYVLLLKRQAIQPSQALSLSFMVIAIPTIMSLIGGLFFIFYKHKGVQTPTLSEEKI